MSIRQIKMIIYLYLFIVLGIVSVESSSIRTRHNRNYREGYLTSKSESEKGDTNNLKVISNEPFIDKVQVPKTQDMAASKVGKERENGKDRSRKQKKRFTSKKRIPKLSTLWKKYRIRRHLQDQYSKNIPDDIPTVNEPEILTTGSKQKRSVNEKLGAQRHARPHVESGTHGHHFNEQPKKSEVVGNVREDENIVKPLMIESRNRIPKDQIHHGATASQIRFAKTSEKEPEKLQNNNEFGQDSIIDPMKLEEEIKNIRNMLQKNHSQTSLLDTLRVRRKTATDETASKLAKLLVTLTALNSFHDRRKPKCNDEGCHNKNERIEKRPNYIEKRSSSRINEERDNLKKWIELLKAKRSGKACSCTYNAFDDDMGVYPLENKTIKGNSPFDYVKNSEERYDGGMKVPNGFEYGTSLDRGDRGLDRIKQFKPEESDHVNLTNRGRRKLDLGIDDLESYRSKARQILKNAEEILEKIKQEERRRQGAGFIINQMRESTSEPKGTQNEKNLTFVATSKHLGENDGNISLIKSYVLDPNDEARALAKESNRMLFDHLLRNSDKFKEGNRHQGIRGKETLTDDLDINENGEDMTQSYQRQYPSSGGVSTSGNLQLEENEKSDKEKDVRKLSNEPTAIELIKQGEMKNIGEDFNMENVKEVKENFEKTHDVLEGQKAGMKHFDEVLEITPEADELSEASEKSKEDLPGGTHIVEGSENVNNDLHISSLRRDNVKDRSSNENFTGEISEKLIIADKNNKTGKYNTEGNVNAPESQIANGPLIENVLKSKRVDDTTNKTYDNPEVEEKYKKDSKEVSDSTSVISNFETTKKTNPKGISAEKGEKSELSRQGIPNSNVQDKEKVENKKFKTYDQQKINDGTVEDKESVKYTTVNVTDPETLINKNPIVFTQTEKLKNEEGTGVSTENDTTGGKNTDTDKINAEELLQAVRNFKKVNDEIYDNIFEKELPVGEEDSEEVNANKERVKPVEGRNATPVKEYVSSVNKPTGGLNELESKPDVREAEDLSRGNLTKNSDIIKVNLKKGNEEDLLVKSIENQEESSVKESRYTSSTTEKDGNGKTDKNEEFSKVESDPNLLSVMKEFQGLENQRNINKENENRVTEKQIHSGSPKSNKPNKEDHSTESLPRETHQYRSKYPNNVENGTVNMGKDAALEESDEKNENQSLKNVIVSTGNHSPNPRNDKEVDNDENQSVEDENETVLKKTLSKYGRNNVELENQTEENKTSSKQNEDLSNFEDEDDHNGAKNADNYENDSGNLKSNKESSNEDDILNKNENDSRVEETSALNRNDENDKNNSRDEKNKESQEKTKPYHKIKSETLNAALDGDKSKSHAIHPSTDDDVVSENFTLDEVRPEIKGNRDETYKKNKPKAKLYDEMNGTSPVNNVIGEDHKSSKQNKPKSNKLQVPKSIGDIMRDLKRGSVSNDDIASFQDLNPEKIDQLIDKIDEVEQKNKNAEKENADCEKKCLCAEEINLRAKNLGRYEIAKDFLHWIKNNLKT